MAFDRTAFVEKSDGWAAACGVGKTASRFGVEGEKGYGEGSVVASSNAEEIVGKGSDGAVSDSGLCLSEGIDAVSLRVRAGECVLLCGPSGCGKTTVTRVANGLAPSFFPGCLTGRVLIGGQDITALSSHDIARSVGSVFQNPRTQFFATDVESEIAFGMESLAWDEDVLRARVAQTIDELGLESLRGRSIFSLSGGEKQKVAFASVYATNPAAFVLDEPSSNLDIDTINELRDYINALKRSGKAILIAEHRLHWLMDVFDRAIIMRDGRVIDECSPDEMRRLDPGQIAERGLRVCSLDDVRVRCDGAKRETRETPPARKRKEERQQKAVWPKGPSELKVEGMTVCHKKRTIIDDVSFSLRAGEVTALIGRNGVGKTTLVRALCGLHPHDKGSITFGGQPLNRRDCMKLSCLVFQDVNYQLFAESVEAEVSFALDDVLPEKVKDALDRVGLAPFSARHPATLSGGQKQRLAVAVSHVTDKDMLFFDEPTSGLDSDAMERVAQLIGSLAGQNKVVMVVTHDLEFIAAVCDRVIPVRDGRMEDDFLTKRDMPAIRRLWG